MIREKAIVLVSGGLDSATTLGIARSEGYACYAMSFDYGQRHKVELESAIRLCKGKVEDHKVVSLDLAWIGGSALTDQSIDIPQNDVGGIPVTYVPARNTVFLSMALAWAEVLDVFDILIGVNAVDYSGYPDCRPDFISAYTNLANLATKSGVEGNQFEIHTPLIELSKSAIIQRGLDLGIDYGETISCYQPDEEGRACGVCASCRIRRKGFEELGANDPTKYLAK